MLQKFAGFFWRIAGWKSFIAALFLYMIFAGYIMPKGAQMIEQISGKKVEILDFQFTYTPEKARAIIGEYGDAARNFAANFELIADTIYPIVYTFLFLIIMSWILKSLAEYGFRLKHVQLLPLLVLVAAYWENTCVIDMLKNFPGFSDNVAIAASFFTSLKWGLMVAQAFIIGAAIWLLTFYKMTRGKVAGK